MGRHRPTNAPILRLRSRMGTPVPQAPAPPEGGPPGIPGRGRLSTFPSGCAPDDPVPCLPAPTLSPPLARSPRGGPPSRPARSPRSGRRGPRRGGRTLSVSEPVRVLVTPKDENPYQRLLYEEVTAAGAQVRYADGPSGSHTINLLLAPLMLAWYRLRGYQLLHIHWVFQFSLPWARRATTARRAMQCWFWFYLWLAGALGYRVVWTAHDLMPHDQVFFDDGRARQYLIDRSD